VPDEHVNADAILGLFILMTEGQADTARTATTAAIYDIRMMNKLVVL
jgi:hypothetical protein